MKVRLEIQFESPTAADEASLRRLALGLTNDRDSVRVVAREDQQDWFVAEFTMPTEAQYKAVDTIDGQIRLFLLNRMDSIICFPKTATKTRRPRGKSQQ